MSTDTENNRPNVMGIIIWIAVIFWTAVCIGIAIVKPQLFVTLALIAGGGLLVISIAWIMGVLE